MNRIYKVVWNQALHCFTAVSEYAKGRGKSSTSSVSANATINPTNHLSIIKTLRLSTIALGLLAAGFGMPANSEVSYFNTMYITGHQSHGNGNGNGHESHGNGNGYGHNHNGNSSNDKLKFDGDTGRTVVRKHGQTLTIEGGEDNRRKLANGKNIGVVADGRDTLTIKLAKNLTDLDSVTFNGGVVISSAGINAGNKTISGVADGVAGNDAVNLNQLTDTVAANKTKYYSVKSTASGNANNDGATGSNAMAMGGNASATGGQAIAIGSGQSGQNTVASGQQSIAIGANVVSKGHSSIAIGGDDLDHASKANIDGTSASTLNGGDVNAMFSSYTGRNLVETPRYKVNTESGGAASIAIGAKSLSKGALSTAVGVQSSSSGVASSAFGIGASASEKGSVALGAGSVANVAGGVAGYVPTGVSTADAMAITNTQSGTNSGAVSVGSSIEGGTRQIVNVAAGKNDSDAVNVSQLKALDTMVAGIDFPIRSSNAQPYTTSVVGTDALAVGSNAEANGNNSTAVGENTKAIGIQASAFGSGAEATARSSLASGFEAKAIGVESVALGVKSNAEGLGATAVGPTARARGENSTALGRRSKADSNGTLALGGFSKAVGENASAVGVNAEATKKNATAVGVNAKAEGERSVALGEGAQATTLTGTAIGSRTLASAVQSTAVGVGSKATKQWATSMGFSSQANGVSSVALGDRSEVSGKESIAIGKGNTVTGSNSIAIGTGHTIVGDNSGAFGDPNNITGSGSYVIGNDNTVANNNTFVLGNGVETTQDNSVVLGNLSTDRAATMETGVTISGTPYTYAGSAPIGVTSVGFVGGERQIINVAAGAVNATSTDAINGSQLYATNEAVDSNTTTINKGFALKAADGNTVQKPLGQAVEVVGSNDNIDTRVKNGKIEVKLNNDLDLGSNGSVEMGSSFPGGFGRTTTLDRSGLTTGNSYVSTTVDGLGVRTGSVLASTSVNGLGVFVNGPLGIPKTVLSMDGLTIIGGPSVTKSGGINAGNKRVINVDDGIQAKDAVNVSQLNNASAAAKTEVAAGTNIAGVVKSTGGNGQDVYTVNADGVTASAGSAAVTVTAGEKDETTNTTDYAIDLSVDSKASLVKADSAMQTIIAQIDGADVKTLNQTDNTANFLTGDNIVLSADDGGIKVATAEDVTFTSASFANSTVRVSSEGLDNGGNRIINVDNGQADTDAVNVRQLNAINNTVDLGLNFTGDDTTVVVNRKLGQTLTLQGGATNVTENNIGVIADEDGNLNVRLAEDVMLGKNGSVRMESTVLNNAGVTITDGPNQTITLSNEGLDNGNNRIIKVGEGIAPSDAVNFAQLTVTNEEIAKGIKIGDGNSDNDQQFALGDTINITGDSNLTTVASATGVQVQLNSQLDLGDAGSLQIGNSIMNNTGFTFIDSGQGRTVTLSSRGLDNGGNPISNVGAGELNTDAVNVGQLKEIAIALDQGWGITAQGDIATMVKQGDAVDLNSKDGNIKVSRTSFSDAVALDGNPSIQASAIPINANDISFDLNPDIALDSVTTGDTTINDNGLTIVDGPSITKSGIDAANNKVTNVQDGEVSATSQDAVNGGQLYAQGSGISSIIGGDTVYNAESGTFTNSNIGGTGESNIDGAIASIRQGTIEINENVQVNTNNITTNTSNIASNSANIATNTSNITTNTTNIQSNTEKLDAGLNFGADSGATINKPVGDDSVLSFIGGNNITTTAEGSSITFDLNGNISVDSVTAGTTVINSSGISMQDGPSMTAQGLYAGNQRITGVADGIEATDAVNYSQLSALDSRLNSNMSDLGYKIDEVEDDANAGISAAMAMAALPQAYISGKSLIGGGISTYNGESAVAIGVSKLSNDGRWVIKVNGTADTQGNVGGAIGAGFHFD